MKNTIGLAAWLKRAIAVAILCAIALSMNGSAMAVARGTDKTAIERTVVDYLTDAAYM